jgi:hypothetical protein
MARKVKVKQILELNYLGVSNNKISDTRSISKHSIQQVLVMAQEKGIIFPNIQDRTDQEVYKLFFPDNYCMEDFYESVDFKDVNKELKIKGVTLKILWNEYNDRCSLNKSFAMSYTKFCRDYNKYIAHNNLTNHLVHKPGESVEVDWAGKVMHFYSLGIPKKVYIFVGSLPFSQYTYIEPCLNMKEKSWIECHIHMWNYFGGVTPRTICDNLKTGVIKHPKDGEIILNDNYESLANHYVTAILPAGVRKPKQKSSALLIYSYYFASLSKSSL